MAETSPLLLLSLARYRQLRQRQEERDAEDEQQQQQRLDQQQRSSQTLRRQISMSRRRPASPILPVIHEDEQSSHASPGSNHARALIENNGSFTSSSSSGSNSRYANFNSMSNQIVWPPEAEDDVSWPPNSCSQNEEEEEDDNDGDNQDERVHYNNNNYGTIPAGYFIESEDYISSSSPSSSEGSREYVYRSRRDYLARNRYLKSFFIAICAVSLSAVIWVPLLEEQPPSSSSSQVHSDHSKSPKNPPAWLYFRARHRYDEEDDDYYIDDSSSSSQDEYPISDSYHHFYRSDGFDNSSSSKLSEQGITGSGNGDSGNQTQSMEPIVIGNFSSIPANTSFADLAAILLPPYFQKTVSLSVSTIIPTTILIEGDDGEGTLRVNTTSVMPGEVYQLRKQMLKTRDLLDVFSPLYSKHSSLVDYEDEASRMKHLSWGKGGHKFELTLESDRHGKARKKGGSTSTSSEDVDDDKKSTVEIKDLWKILRNFLDDGYQLIGEFQDLDHARIMYTPEQLAEYQLQVWQWYIEFDQFIEEHRDHISLYLSLPCRKKHPSSKHARCSHIHSHSSHLFWGTASKDELPDGNTDMASSGLMRLGRSQLERAEHYLRQSLKYDHVISTTDNLTENNTVHEHYHNARKELRSFLDEVTLFGNFIVPGSSLVPEISRSAPIDQNREPPSPEQEQTSESLIVLKQARKFLGDLNDDYVAYTVYLEWEEYPEEQERLHKAVKAQWENFQVWVQEAKLFAKIQSLIDIMGQKEDQAESSVLKQQSGEYYRSSNPAFNVDSFLIERKTTPTNHYVLGNDAGDADSIISAITLAYIESMDKNNLMTPIVSLSKDAFTHERPDINLLLQLAGIEDSSSKVLFIEDLIDMLDSGAGHMQPINAITLVDHNTINKSLRKHEQNLTVTEIVDHHKDEGLYKNTCTGSGRNIAFDHDRALVASTTTLVAEILRGHPPPYPTSLGILLIGVILLDSVNLDESVGKVTQRDRDAVHDLILHTDWSQAAPSSFIRIGDNGGIEIDTNELFMKLQGAKYDLAFWNLMSTTRALGYDYKAFHHNGNGLGYALKEERPHEVNFGISSVLMSGLDFMKKDDFYKKTIDFMKSKQIPLLGIMFAFYDEWKVFHRQLAFVWVGQTISIHELLASLMASEAYVSEDLQLQEVTLPKKLRRRGDVCLFDQKNVAPSRKQIGPMLEIF